MLKAKCSGIYIKLRENREYSFLIYTISMPGPEAIEAKRRWLTFSNWAWLLIPFVHKKETEINTLDTTVVSPSLDIQIFGGRVPRLIKESIGITLIKYKTKIN